MNVSDTCNAAADLLHGRGWTTGHHGWGWEGESVPLCLEGAIAAASGITEAIGIEVRHCPAYKAVRDHLGGTQPWLWNDSLAFSQVSDNPFPNLTPESRAWAADRVIATLRAVAVIHAAREDESVETRTVEAVSA